jgi:hypothetical protein
MYCRPVSWEKEIFYHAVSGTIVSQISSETAVPNGISHLLKNIEFVIRNVHLI